MTFQSLHDFIGKQILESNPHMAETPVLCLATHQEFTGIGHGNGNSYLTTERDDIKADAVSSWEDFFEPLFKLAGIEILGHHELTNQYWPRAYVFDILTSPWWLVKTQAGYVKIGWRKRVISIDWKETDIRMIVTEDEVTKGKDHVHAYGKEPCLTYLSALKPFLNMEKDSQ